MRNNWPSQSFAWWTLGLICVCLCVVHLFAGYFWLYFCNVTLTELCSSKDKGDAYNHVFHLRVFALMLVSIEMPICPAFVCCWWAQTNDGQCWERVRGGQRRPLCQGCSCPPTRLQKCKTAKLHCILNPSALQLLHYCAAQIALHLLYLSANVHWSLLNSYF